MNLPIQELLSKKMTRAEFLKLFGVAVLSLFGINNFLSYVMQNRNMGNVATTQKPQDTTVAAHGFGSRKFGQ